MLGGEVKFDHDDVVQSENRFAPVIFRNEKWDLSHLNPFSIRLDPGLGFEVAVVILFTCHCFTHSIPWDGRSPDDIPEDELFYEDRTPRVLSVERYEASRRLLREMIQNLAVRLIRVGEHGKQFFTFEDLSQHEAGKQYIAYFEVTKDTRRKKRLLLRVQSAYPLDQPMTKRQQKAGKVKFATLVKAIYEGRGIAG
jgi:hypothetical protein